MLIAEHELAPRQTPLAHGTEKVMMYLFFYWEWV